MQNKKSNIIGWLVCVLGAIFYCYEYLLRIEPSVMVNPLMLQLNIAATSFGLITAFYYYAYTPMQIVVGVLLDRYGVRLMLGIAIVICTLGSFLFSIAHSVYLAGFARFLIGFGSAFAFVGVLKLAAEWLPLRHFAMFAGMTTSLGMFGGMLGDIGLTRLINQIGWQKTLHVGTCVGVLLIPLIFIFLHNKPKTEKVKSDLTLANTIQGVKQSMKNPQMWICGLIGAVFYLSLSAFAELWGIKFLENVYTLAPKQGALACSMIFIGWLIGGPISGWLSDHIRSRKIPLIVGGGLAAICFTVILLKPAHLNYLGICTLLLLFGIFSSVEIICFAISRESNHKSLAASSVAFTNFLVMVGGMIFQPLLGMLLDLGWDGKILDGVHVYSTINYQVAFSIIPICIIVGVLLTLKLKETL